VRTCARSNNEKERVLDLSMQPNDAGQAAKYLTLSALLQHR